MIRKICQITNRSNERFFYAVIYNSVIKLIKNIYITLKSIYIQHINYTQIMILALMTIYFKKSF